MKLVTVLTLSFSLGLFSMEAPKVPAIDIDNIDWAVFQEIVETCGSFELVGKSMERLAQFAVPAIELAKNIFDQPKEDLLATVPEGQNKFHGFQDVRNPLLRIKNFLVIKLLFISNPISLNHFLKM